MRSYTVFNIDQVEGHHLDHLRVGHSVSNTNPVDTYEEADRVIEATGADIRYGGNQAFYSPSGDFIQVPLREQFSAGEWYETIFHELCHWTQPRLNWNPAEGGYALGELMAEIGSCYLASELGIPTGGDLGQSPELHSQLAAWSAKRSPLHLSGHSNAPVCILRGPSGLDSVNVPHSQQTHL